MSRMPRMMLPFVNWPAQDQERWQAAFETGDRFDENSPGAHLAESTRQMGRESYGRFLGFISAHHQGVLSHPPEARIDRHIVAEYVAWRRKSCGDVAVAIDLDHLRGALKLVCPGADWSWLLTITKRIAAGAPRKARKYHQVTSDHLYALGIKLMDHAIASAHAAKPISAAHAFEYRDGLVIALVALIPMRRRTLAALRIGNHLVRIGDIWALDIPAADTKSRRPLDYSISKELSACIDLYLECFRCRIPGADMHSGLWASKQRRPMCGMAISATVGRRTKEAFGFRVNLHRFRHAAATFWSIRDPANVRGSKDLLGQASYGTTEKHYIMSQSRFAGRALARAVEEVRRTGEQLPLGS